MQKRLFYLSNYCTTFGLSKAIDKVNFSAFRELLVHTQKLIPTTAVFKGYRVIAVDGVKGELPNTPEIMKKYKPSKTALYPMFHAVASFDVLNCKFIDAGFEMSPTNERKAAIKLIDNHLSENDIFLFGRGFPSIALIQKLEEKQLNFVARVSTSFIKEVNEFAPQKYLDKTIHIDYTKERAKSSKVKNLELPCSFGLRCVKVILPNGNTEILITNLQKDVFKRKDIETLYLLRWGIETSFNHLKNAINIEEFVGIKENSIKQEFYSILIEYNLVMQYIEEVKTVGYLCKKTEKLEYKYNFRKAAGIIIPQISVMLYSKQNKLSKIIDNILNIIKDFKSAIRSNRAYKRNPNSSRHSIYYRHNNMLCLS